MYQEHDVAKATGFTDDDLVDVVTSQARKERFLVGPERLTRSYCLLMRVIILEGNVQDVLNAGQQFQSCRWLAARQRQEGQTQVHFVGRQRYCPHVVHHREPEQLRRQLWYCGANTLYTTARHETTYELGCFARELGLGANLTVYVERTLRTSGCNGYQSQRRLFQPPQYNGVASVNFSQLSVQLGQ